MEEGYTLDEALALDETFESLYEDYTCIYDAVNLFYEYYLATGSVSEAEDLVDEIMTEAIETALD